MAESGAQEGDPARRVPVLDVPGGWLSHLVPALRGGGAPVAAGLAAAALIGPGNGTARLALLLAVLFFGLLGLFDDLCGLPAVSRLALQAVGALAVGALLSFSVSLPAAAAAAATLGVAAWLAGFVNAFGFMDGVNGISGAHALIGGVFYACLAGWSGDQFGVIAGLALACGAAAFLPWNAGQGRVFLGGVGSCSIGAALAVLAARLVLRGVPPEAVTGPIALYLADTAWTMQRRMTNDERWLEARRTHVYQRWCDAGYSHQDVTGASSTLTVLLCLLGVVALIGGMAARLTADLTGLGVIAVYLASPALLTRSKAV